jgi:hypothetical protein
MTPQSEFARRIAIANVDVAIAAEQVRQAMERLQRATADLERLEQEAGTFGADADPRSPEVEETTIPDPAETTETEEATSRLSIQEPRDASSERLTIVHGPDAEPTAVVEDADDDLDWPRRPEDDPTTLLRELANLGF